VADGDYVLLEVSDTGGGMSPETQARVFDPFFTTKSAGHGLGLAVVQGIVRHVGGAIHLASAPGRGTTVQILLPRAEAVGDSTHEAISGAREVAQASDKFTVLVVEDEDPLRQAVAKMLRKTGFDVLEVANGAAAIDLLRANGRNIDLILLDMTIPGPPSQEVVAEAAQIRPDLKVLLTSAYSEEMATATISTPLIRGFIRKPFQLRLLAQTLREVLYS
jgi:CheY-like chemotaxis protein